MNVGSIASSDLAQLEAQVNSDNYQLVTSQATLQDYKLQLKQLLELDGGASWAVLLTWKYAYDPFLIFVPCQYIHHWFVISRLDVQ